MKQGITAILVDDEILAIKRLKRLLEKYNDYIEILAEASNGEQAVQLIDQYKPDLIFLDIEMPGFNGFEVLEKILHNPMVIFTTAFDSYALKAFEENSVDYLLKPIESERLDKAIEKLQRLSKDSDIKLQPQLHKLIEALNTRKEFKSFPVKIGDKIIFIKPEDISYLEAKDKYVFIVTDENKEYLTDFSLSSLEDKLPRNFVRVHRAHIINTDKIKEIHKGFNSCFSIIMKDSAKSRIQTGRSYNDQVKAIFEL